MSSEASKPAKKIRVDQDEAEDRMSLGSLFQDRKKKPSIGGSYSLPRVKKEEVRSEGGLERTPKINSGSATASKVTKIKKEERFNYHDDDYDDKPGKKSSVAKREMELKKKRKMKEEEEKSKNSKAELESKKRERKEKKVYDLPGQKRDPPEERDPLRIFYESLHEQIPHSEMAQFWMMESGLLSKEVAKKVYEKKQKKAALQKISSPVKSVSVSASAVRSVTKTTIVKKKVLSPPVSSIKRKVVDSKVTSQQSKKRKSVDESSSEDESDDEYSCSDDDFPIGKTLKKKPRVA